MAPTSSTLAQNVQSVLLSALPPSIVPLIVPRLTAALTAITSIATPQSIKYFIILILLRYLQSAFLPNSKIPIKVEHFTYFMFLEPTMFTLLHTVGSRRTLTEKYRAMLDRNMYPTIGRRYITVDSCKQLHPGNPDCIASGFAEWPVTVQKVSSMYIRFYIIQYCYTLVIRLATFLYGRFADHVKRRKELQAERERLERERIAADLEKPKRVDSAVEMSTYFGRMSKLPDMPKKIPEVIEAVRRHSISAGPTSPVQENGHRSSNQGKHKDPLYVFVIRILLRDLKDFVEGWFRSTAFLSTNMFLHRLGQCYLLRSTGEPLYKHRVAYYLLSALGATPIVFERDFRVRLINRMLFTFILGEIFPPSLNTYDSMLPLLGATMLPLGLSGKLNMIALAGAAFSAYQM
ncbi:hypothetical protein M427DRAFT_60828 [Gonapodya prolifera JEL478]|uniref:Uncharacterized protein n=1 Tax=Gonapodya prolifera (strain JEL478) TaxID=1344416 RepID=A0A139A3L8_GONPJ|nr:hypothetical protein M427DRAFT_60828 [Gonapodya prolifera JEL478]|eukprot:KXS11259.1 hypothetical protein M427DRAFT_60828 [Gonapodya prolifera JEL478]